MKKISFLFCFGLAAIAGQAQYKNDNVLFKTVYTQDLCAELNNHPGYLLLDVRSPGEYADTSSMGMNIGRFKNAINIEARELGKHIAGIAAYRNTPVFVYCSHSQRSRRASKMLADSGFTQVFNINGGMTGLRQLPVEANKCMYDKLETKNTYDIISAATLCNRISSSLKNIFLLDVRSDSAFRHISTDAKTNAFGHFRNAVNIPLQQLEANLSKVPMDKEVIITDMYGDEAADAAELLKKKNYPNVSILLEGIDRLLYSDSRTLGCLPAAFVSDIPYKITNALEFKSFLETAKDYLLLDVRTTDEFNNKHKNYWQNIGHLENAINIPAAELGNQWERISAYKTRPVILYMFGTGAPVYEAAALLVKNGFSDVRVLQGGIFSIGWTAANVKGYSSLARLRVDVPAENQ